MLARCLLLLLLAGPFLLLPLPCLAGVTNYVSLVGSHTSPFETWGKAATNIQTAVDYASTNYPTYDTVMVSNGTYHITAEISVTNGITVTSLNGVDLTTVARSSGSIRIFNVSNANAVVDGFTISNGYNVVGSGLWLTDGTVRNCRITKNNSVGNDGGGVYMTAGTLEDSEICLNKNTAGSYARGGGIRMDGNSALVQRCYIWENSSFKAGGGVYIGYNGGGTLRNCLVIGNEAGGTGLDGNAISGGGVGIELSSGIVESCTIVGNKGFGIYRRLGGYVRNSVIYYNQTPDGNPTGSPSENWCNFSGSSISNCCTTTSSAFPNSTDGDPDFTDGGSGYGLTHVQGDYRLQPGSPCLDTGGYLAWMSGAVDLDGNDRLYDAHVDMGTYEARDDEGAFRCNLIADNPSGLALHTVNFTANVAGANTNGLYYWWDFDNSGGTADEDGADKGTTSHEYATGIYSVLLTVSNAAEDVVTSFKTNYIVSCPGSLYVAASGAAVAPYASWANAATSIHDAVEIAVGGTTVLLTNETYSIPHQIMITKNITVRGLNGYDSTIIKAPGVSGTRCFYMAEAGAMLDGLTITNGNMNGDGGGVWMSAGIVSNCLIVGNTCTATHSHDGGGGGVYMTGGTVTDSKIIDNIVTFGGWSRGGGICMKGGLADRCHLERNWSASGGAGVYLIRGGTLRNCLVVGNELSADGGLKGGGVGIESAPAYVENCSIVSNKGFGIWQRSNGAATITNTVIQFNADYAGSVVSNWSNLGASVKASHCCTEPLGAIFLSSTTNDPQFVNASAGNYRLKRTSPCIDKGTNQVWMIGTLDLAGQSRLLNESVDMGAYEIFVPWAGTVILFR